jgi:hypothetical protein
MLEKNWYRRIFAISLIILLCQTYLHNAATSSSYSKTWIQSDGSELEIAISSYVTNLVVDTKYTYRITLEAKSFGSSLDGFFSIALGLRFVSSEQTIKSDLKCDVGDLTTAGSKLHVLLPLIIPSAHQFSLNLGESIQGQLEYIIYYSEQVKDWDKSEMAPNQWPHESDISLGWVIISQGKIINPYINFETSVIITLAIISLSGSGIFIYYMTRKRNNRD